MRSAECGMWSEERWNGAFGFSLRVPRSTLVRGSTPSPSAIGDCPGGETEIMARFERAGPGSTPGRGTSVLSTEYSVRSQLDVGVCGVTVCMRDCEPRGAGFDSRQIPDWSTGVCSWESKLPPKQPHRVRILALLLHAGVARHRKAPHP